MHRTDVQPEVIGVHSLWQQSWWCVLVSPAYNTVVFTFLNTWRRLPSPESGLPACVRSDHAGPPRRAPGEEEEEEEEDAAGAQRVPAACRRAGQEEGGPPLGAGGPPRHPVHGRADGRRARTGPEEGLPPYVPALPRQPAAEER